MDQSIPERPSPSSHDVDMCLSHVNLSLTINMISIHTFSQDLMQIIVFYSCIPQGPLCVFFQHSDFFFLYGFASWELFYLSMFVSIETGYKYNKRKLWKETSNDIKAQEGTNVYQNDHLMVWGQTSRGIIQTTRLILGLFSWHHHLFLVRFIFLTLVSLYFLSSIFSSCQGSFCPTLSTLYNIIFFPNRFENALFFKKLPSLALILIKWHTVYLWCLYTLFIVTSFDKVKPDLSNIRNRFPIYPEFKFCVDLIVCVWTGFRPWDILFYWGIKKKWYTGAFCCCW